MFHGWKLAGALSVILFFTAGGGLYVFPVFIGSFQAEFGWSMTEISAGAALFAVVLGFSNPLVGTLFARFGARRTMTAAAVLSVVAYLGYAALVDLRMLYAIMLVSGLGVAGTTILPAQTLITHWFDTYRGRAMGVTMLGIGAGGLALPPLNELLIRLLGWRLTWVVSAGILLLLVVPLIAIFVRTVPAEMGLSPDGVDGDPDDPSPAARGLPTRRAVSTPTFWLLVGIFLSQLIGVSALNFHFVPFANQQAGFMPQQSALFYGLTVGFSIAGRLLFGWLADRWRPTLLLSLAGSLLAVGPVVLEVGIVRLGIREPALLWLYAIPFGIGIGGNAVTIPVLVGRCFGALDFSRIMGLLMSGFAVGVIVGIPVAGWIFDRTGSYEWVLILCGLTLVISATLPTLIRPERYHAEFVSAG